MGSCSALVVAIKCILCELNCINAPGFSGGSADKESSCNAGDVGLIPGWGKSPGWEHGNRLQYSCLENPRGQRSLADYSP